MIHKKSVDIKAHYAHMHTMLFTLRKCWFPILKNITKVYRATLTRPLMLPCISLYTTLAI